MTARPSRRPTYVLGPVSVYERLHEDTGSPVAICAWVGDYCVAEYSCDEAVVEHPTDPTRNVDRVEPDGDLASEWIYDRLHEWLGYGR